MRKQRKWRRRSGRPGSFYSVKDKPQLPPVIAGKLTEEQKAKYLAMMAKMENEIMPESALVAEDEVTEFVLGPTPVQELTEPPPPPGFAVVPPIPPGDRAGFWIPGPTPEQEREYEKECRERFWATLETAPAPTSIDMGPAPVDTPGPDEQVIKVNLALVKRIELLEAERARYIEKANVFEANIESLRDEIKGVSAGIGELYIVATKGPDSAKIQFEAIQALCSSIGIPPQLIPPKARAFITEQLNTAWPILRKSPARRFIQQFKMVGSFDTAMARIEQFCTMADVLETIMRPIPDSVIADFLKKECDDHKQS